MLKSTDARGAVGAARPRHDNANKCASVVSASAEAPEGSSVEEVAEDYRARVGRCSSTSLERLGLVTRQRSR